MANTSPLAVWTVMGDFFNVSGSGRRIDHLRHSLELTFAGYFFFDFDSTRPLGKDSL